MIPPVPNFLTLPNAPYKDARAYAKADGSTNDTTALNTAAAAAAGGILLFSKGTGAYMVDGSITISSNTTVIIAPGAEIKAMATSTAYQQILRVRGTDANNRITNVHVIGPGKVNGNKAARVLAGLTLTANTTELINLAYATNCSVEGVELVDGTADGIDADSCEACWFTRNYVTGAAGFGIHISDATTNCFVGWNWVEACGDDLSRGGIDHYSTASDNTYIGNTCKDNYQNYDIDGSGARFDESNQSINGTNADVLTGVYYRLPATRIGIGEHTTDPSFTFDINTNTNDLASTFAWIQAGTGPITFWCNKSGTGSFAWGYDIASDTWRLVRTNDITSTSEQTGFHIRRSPFRAGFGRRTPLYDFDVAGTVNAESIFRLGGTGVGGTTGVDSGVTWTKGSGSPEGVVTARIGSIYSRTDGSTGTSLYVKEANTDATGWVAK